MPRDRLAASRTRGGSWPDRGTIRAAARRLHRGRAGPVRRLWAHVHGPRFRVWRDGTPFTPARVEGLAVSPDGQVGRLGEPGRDAEGLGDRHRRQVGESVESAGGFACVDYSPKAAPWSPGDRGRRHPGRSRGDARPASVVIIGRVGAFGRLRPRRRRRGLGLRRRGRPRLGRRLGPVRSTLAGHVRAEAGPDFAPGLEPPLSVHGLAFSLDGRTLASAGVDGQVILWDMPSGRARARFPGMRAALVGRVLARRATIAAGGSLGIALLDAEGGRSVPRGGLRPHHVDRLSPRRGDARLGRSRRRRPLGRVRRPGPPPTAGRPGSRPREGPGRLPRRVEDCRRDERRGRAVLGPRRDSS